MESFSFRRNKNVFVVEWNHRHLWVAFFPNICFSSQQKSVFLSFSVKVSKREGKTNLFTFDPRTTKKLVRAKKFDATENPTSCFSQEKPSGPCSTKEICSSGCNWQNWSKLRQRAKRVMAATVGRGGGQVVSVLAYYSDNPSLNPVDY